MQEFVLKAKNTIKRIAAISAGAVMLGATAFGAVAAADLSDYPAPFVADGAWVGLIVVGSAAEAGDIVGATDIAASLAQQTTTAATGTETSVSGGKKQEVNINEAINDASNFGTTLDDEDISGLMDSELDFDDSAYNYREVVKLGSGGLTPTTGLLTSDYDYGSEIALELKRGDLGYYFLFDETINMSAASSTEPLEITMLGNNLKITSIDAHNKLTAEVGTEYFLNVGDSIVVDGKTVILQNVASCSSTPCAIIISVNGVQETVSGGVTEKVGPKGEQIKIYPSETFYSDTLSERSATLLMGDDTTKSYTDGDAWIGEPETGYDWEWDLGDLTNTTLKGDTDVTAGTGPTIGMRNKYIVDDWSDGPVIAGESYCFPGDYICVEFNKLTVKDYAKVEIYFDDALDLNDAGPRGAIAGSSADALVIESTVEDIFYIDADGACWDSTNSTNMAGDVSTNTLYIVANTTAATNNLTIYMTNEDNDIVELGTFDADETCDLGYIDYKDTSGTGDIELSTLGNLTLKTWVLAINDENSNSDAEELYIGANWSTDDEFAFLGKTADTEEATDLVYGSTNVGTKDDGDLRTTYGIIVDEPKGSTSDDKIILHIPSDIVEAEIVITGPGAVISSSSTGVSVNSVAGIALVKLDTEVGAADKAMPLIIVGDSCVNKIAAEVAGVTYPTCGAALTDTYGFAEGEAVLKLYENAFSGTNVALVVAGWNAADTRNAANVLKNFGSYSTQLTGTAVKVVGTTVTAIADTPAVTP